MTDYLNDPRFAHAVSEFESACHCSRAWDAKLKEYLEIYGNIGVAISGAGREHFPDDVKDHMRRIAKAVTHHSDLGHAARPYRVHTSTMIKVARAVASRDGSGFYGPQPYMVSL